MTYPQQPWSNSQPDGQPTQATGSPAPSTGSPIPASPAVGSPAPGSPTPGYGYNEPTTVYPSGYQAPGGYQDPGGYQAPGGYQDPAAGYPAAAYPPYGYVVAPASKPTNGMAIASLVVSCLGAVGLCGYGIGGIIGVVGAILGHVARRQIRQRGDGGDGLALAGVIVGWISTVIAIIAAGIIAALIIYAVNHDGDSDLTTTTLMAAFSQQAE